jgi:hypothetical protein
MPNSHVQAAAEGMPKFDLAAIMRKASEKYRDFRNRYAAWQIARGIVDASFSNCLKIAWRLAKAEAAARSAAVASIARYGDRASDRVRDLAAELMRIDVQPWGMRSHRRSTARAALSNEIAVLTRRAF